MPRKKKKATKPVAKNLKKDQILMVGMLFGNLVNVDVITTKLVTAVDEQQHVHHFQGRHESWVHIKSATNDLRTIIESGIKKYLQLYLTYNTGSEKYGRFLANWYTYVGSWAVGCLSNDHEQMTWNSITSDHEISVDDRSCLMHSLFSALFTSLSNIMDAAQSKLFTDVVSPATSVAATCTISDTSDDDESLYRIAGFALHSCIKLRKMMLKASKKRSRRTVLAKEIEVLEILCCTDKSAIPEKLKLLDRGGLTFPTSGLLPFLQHYSKEIKRHLNHHVLEDRGSDTFKVRICMHIRYCYYNNYNYYRMQKLRSQEIPNCLKSLRMSQCYLANHFIWTM